MASMMKKAIGLRSLLSQVVRPSPQFLQRSGYRYSCSDPSRSPFVTTPIYYVNSDPHVGHIYSTLLADVQYRWGKQEVLSGGSVDHAAPLFSTGTDEHGLKIQQAAQAAGRSPIDHCNLVSGQFKNLFDSCDISYTDYIRTTEPRHQKSVEHFWNVLVDRGFIYKGSFAGWYSISDECFVPEIQTEVMTDDNGCEKRMSTESGNPVEWMEEENYMFRLTSLVPQLKQWFDENPNVIEPSFSATTVLAFLDSDDITDLSVSRSRSRLPWGIPVPGDDTQTIYVWLDALVNYLTVAGYPDDPNFEQRWPPTIQVVGKDILKFHAIYWPAFLLAAGLKLPDQLLAHSHWTMGQKKMSKSRGNVYPAKDLASDFGSVAVRYFLSANNCLWEEAEFSAGKIKERYNDELADILGNLVTRMMSKKCLKNPVYPAIRLDFLPEFIGCNPDRKYSWQLGEGNEGGDIKQLSVDLLEHLVALPELVEESMSRCRVHTTVYHAMDVLRCANGVFHNFQPWKLNKSSDEMARKHLDFCYRLCLETVIAACIVLRPVITQHADDILENLAVHEKDRNLTRARQFRDVLINGAEDQVAGTEFTRANNIPFKKFDLRSEVD